MSNCTWRFFAAITTPGTNGQIAIGGLKSACGGACRRRTIEVPCAKCLHFNDDTGNAGLQTAPRTLPSHHGGERVLDGADAERPIQGRRVGFRRYPGLPSPAARFDLGFKKRPYRPQTHAGVIFRRSPIQRAITHQGADAPRSPVVIASSGTKRLTIWRPVRRPSTAALTMPPA